MHLNPMLLFWEGSQGEPTAWSRPTRDPLRFWLSRSNKPKELPPSRGITSCSSPSAEGPPVALWSSFPSLTREWVLGTSRCARPLPSVSWEGERGAGPEGPQPSPPPLVKEGGGDPLSPFANRAAWGWGLHPTCAASSWVEPCSPFHQGPFNGPLPTHPMPRPLLVPVDDGVEEAAVAPAGGEVVASHALVPLHHALRPEEQLLFGRHILRLAGHLDVRDLGGRRDTSRLGHFLHPDLDCPSASPGLPCVAQEGG